MSRSYFFKVPLIILTFVAIQRSQLGTITISSVHPDFLLAATIFLGLIEGREIGAISGFVLGLFADSFALIPFGVSSLVFAIAGYVAGMVEVTTLPDSKVLDTFVVAAVAACGEAFLAGVLGVMGVSTLLNVLLTQVLIVTTLLTTVMSVPMLPLLRWVLRVGVEDRPPSRRGIRD